MKGDILMKKVLRVTVAIVIMAALVVGYYFFLSRNVKQKDKTDDTVSEYAKIVNTDLVNDYPSTPRSVVKMYNRVITEYYAKDHEDEQVEKLCNQARMLFDDELLAQNPKEEFYKSVKADILTYKNRKARIAQSKVCSSNDVVYNKYNGYDIAYVWAYYFSKEGNDFTKTYQQYCLRKDKNGKWKILTWQLVDGDPDMFD